MRGPLRRFIGVTLLGAVGPLVAPAGCASNNGETKPDETSVAAAVAEPVIPDPSSEQPVNAVAWMVPATIKPGAEVELHVRARIAPGHYLHSTKAEPPFVPTSVELKPSDVVSAAGEWELLTKPDERGRLKETVEFRRRLKVKADAKPGRHQVACGLKYQACTAELCWPPRVLELDAPLVLKGG